MVGSNTIIEIAKEESQNNGTKEVIKINFPERKDLGPQVEEPKLGKLTEVSIRHIPG